MELFDIIELESYITPLAERVQQAQNSRQTIAAANLSESGNEDMGIANPAVHQDWTELTMNVYAPSDLVLVSVDLIRFHVHQGRLVAASTNSFSGNLPIPLTRSNSLPIINIPYIGAVLNILLYIIYNRKGEVSNPSPSISHLSATILGLKEYGVPFETTLAEPSLLFAMFSAICHAGSPLDVYTVAASHSPELHDIAVHASRFLLSLNLYTITDEMADKMGAIYLRRLFMLHMRREEEFKKLLVNPPVTHLPLPHCDAVVLRQVWVLANAYLTWAASPNVAEVTIDDALASIVYRINCHHCQSSLRERFEVLKQKWFAVKSSI